MIVSESQVERAQTDVYQDSEGGQSFTSSCKLASNDSDLDQFISGAFGIYFECMKRQEWMVALVLYLRS